MESGTMGGMSVDSFRVHFDLNSPLASISKFFSSKTSPVNLLTSCTMNPPNSSLLKPSENINFVVAGDHNIMKASFVGKLKLPVFIIHFIDAIINLIINIDILYCIMY